MYFTSFLLFSLSGFGVVVPSVVCVLFGFSVVVVVVVVVVVLFVVEVASGSGRKSAGRTPISLSLTTGVGKSGTWPFFSISWYFARPVKVAGRSSEDLWMFSFI